MQVAPDCTSAQVSGAHSVHVHYFEDANVHMENTNNTESTTIAADDAVGSPPLEALAKLAKKVVRWIKKEEAALQQSIDESCASVGERSIKVLRRRLPVSKQLFNFTADNAMMRTAIAEAKQEMHEAH